MQKTITNGLILCKGLLAIGSKQHEILTGSNSKRGSHRKTNGRYKDVCNCIVTIGLTNMIIVRRIKKHTCVSLFKTYTVFHIRWKQGRMYL